MDVKQAIQTIKSSGTEIPLLNTPTNIIEPNEIVSARTESAKVFDIGHGQRQVKIFACPVHYEDGGVFKSIDPTIKRKPLSADFQGFKYEAKSGVYHAHFDDAKIGHYRFQVGESWVEYVPLFTESDVLKIDIETSLVGVKETITLLDKTAPTSLSWQVARYGNRIITPPPTAHDANGKNVPISVKTDGITLTYDLDVKGAIFPIIIDPTNVIATNAGRVFIQDGTYATARNAVTGMGASSVLVVGQSADYNVWRTFLSYLIPDMATVSSVTLNLDGSLDQSVTDFEIYIHTSTYSNPLVKEDFDLFDGHQASGAYNGTILNDAWNSSSYSANWNTITFNAAGLAVVLGAKNSTLRLVLISKEDFASSQPTDNEYLGFSTTTDVGLEPYLAITYTPPGIAIPIAMDTYRRRRI